ncbi:MAG: hypothetical protein MRK02_02275 [Candidatus Scalindua sp.]|nr:hypothetical protein [Candidatus Scalindua sp.]
MPTYKDCGKCHPKQTKEHRAGGKGSHAHAFHVSTNESTWQVGKPAEEVTACATCYGKAENSCDGCHTRYEFSAAKASKRRRFSELEKKVGVKHKAYKF